MRKRSQQSSRLGGRGASLEGGLSGWRGKFSTSRVDSTAEERVARGSENRNSLRSIGAYPITGCTHMSETGAPLGARGVVEAPEALSSVAFFAAQERCQYRHFPDSLG